MAAHTRREGEPGACGQPAWPLPEGHQAGRHRAGSRKAAAADCSGRGHFYWRPDSCMRTTGRLCAGPMMSQGRSWPKAPQAGRSGGRSCWRRRACRGSPSRPGNEPQGAGLNSPAAGEVATEAEAHQHEREGSWPGRQLTSCRFHVLFPPLPSEPDLHLSAHPTLQ
jgi:hypothetical protein